MAFERLFLIVSHCCFFLFIVVLEASPADGQEDNLHFSRVTDKVGLNYNSENRDVKPHLAVSSVDNDGVYVGDVNGDRWIDVLVTGGTQPALFINDNGTFRRDKSFPTFEAKITAATFVDFDRDQDRDLILIPQKGHIRLLSNDTSGFRKAGKVPKPRLETGIGASVGDFNRDGCPDLFVIQYGPGYKRNTRKQKRYRRGADYRYLEKDNGGQNHLLKGDCEGGFELVESPTFERAHWSLATSFVDVNQDGLMDIHVANDFYRDSLYLAQENGDFVHQYLGYSTSRNGMSSQVTDFNHDSFPDLFVSNIFLSRSSDFIDWDYFTTNVTLSPFGHNALINEIRTDTSGFFRDRAEEYNLKRGGWGWSATWGDFDGDFNRELIQGHQNYLAISSTLEHIRLKDKRVNQFVRKYQKNTRIPLEVRTQDPLFSSIKYWLGYPSVWSRTESSSRGFHQKLGYEFGLSRLNTRGMVNIDYDRDGDLDLIVSQFERPVEVYENRTDKNDTNYIKIHVKIPEFGGTIRLEQEEEKRFIHVTARNDFSSQEPNVYLFGLGESRTLDELQWEGYQFSDRLENVPGGTRITITPNRLKSTQILNDRRDRN